MDIIIIHTSWMEFDPLWILEWKFGNLVLDSDVWPNTRPRCMHLAWRLNPTIRQRIPKNLPFVIRVNSFQKGKGPPPQPNPTTYPHKGILAPCKGRFTRAKYIHNGTWNPLCRGLYPMCVEGKPPPPNKNQPWTLIPGPEGYESLRKGVNTRPTLVHNLPYPQVSMG